MRSALVCMMFAVACLFVPVAHASEIEYQFTGVDPLVGPNYPQFTTYTELTFSLMQGQPPNGAGFNPAFGWVLQYQNTPVEEIFVLNGLVVSDTEKVGAVSLYPDGIGFNPDFSFFGGSQTWIGDPDNPTFVPGIYTNSDEIGDYVELQQVVVPTPEPSSLILLGSGVLAAVGVVRRRLLV